MLRADCDWPLESYGLILKRLRELSSRKGDAGGEDEVETDMNLKDVRGLLNGDLRSTFGRECSQLRSIVLVLSSVLI